MLRLSITCSATSIVDGEVLQLAFYMDNDEDLDWAMDTWKKITKQ